MSILNRLAYNFRLAISRNHSTITQIFASADLMANKDVEVAENLIKYEKEDQDVARFRRKYYSDSAKIKKLLENQNTKSSLSQLEKSESQYLQQVTKEVEDIKKIIELCSKMIQNEQISIIYDMRRPLYQFSHFEKTLSKTLKKVAINTQYSKQITDILISIAKKYRDLANHALELGNRAQLIAIPNSSQGIVMSMSKLTLSKQKLNGKTTSIVNSIKKLEQTFKELKNHKLLSPKESQEVLEAISQFKQSFYELESFCLDRVDASATLLKEARILQISKFKELEEIHQEISELTKAQSGTKSETLLKKVDKTIKKLEDSKGLTKSRNERIERKLVREINRDKIALERVERRAVLDVDKSKGLFENLSTAKVSWVLAGLMAFQATAPTLGFVKEFSSDTEKKEVFVYGTPNQVITAFKAEGLDIDNDLLNKNTLYDYSSNQKMFFRFQLSFSPNFTDTEFLDKDVKEDINSEILDLEKKIVSKVTKDLSSSLKKLGLSKKEKEEIIEQALFLKINLAKGSSVTGTTCPLNSTLDVQRNRDLGKIRAEKGLETLMDLINGKENPLLENIKPDSLKNFDINTVEIRKHAKVSKAIKNINNFYKKNSAKFDEFLGEYPGYRFIKRYDDLNINYKKFSQGDENEYVKFNILARFYKHLDGQGFNKKVLEEMNELRRVEFDFTISIDSKVYGGLDKKTDAVLGVVGVNPISIPPPPVPVFSKKQKIHLPTEYKLRKGYKPGIEKNRPRDVARGNRYIKL